MNTQFPDLKPAAAPITPGVWPTSTHQAMSGARSIIRHGSAEIGRRLRLDFPALTEAEFLTIRNHYRGHRSTFDSFTFDTATLAAGLTPTGYAWRWVGPPQVVDQHADVFDVSCEFVAVIRKPSRFDGAAWLSNAGAFTPGAISGVVPTFNVGGAWSTTSTTFTPGAIQADANFADVGLLLHMDGSDNSTTFTDSSSNGLTVTANGNAKISTAASKFGGASLVLDGNGDYLQVNHNSVIDLIGGDFTVEAWIYCDQFKSSGMRIAAAGGGTVGWNGTNGIHWLWQLTSTGLPQLQYWDGSNVAAAQGTTAVSLTTWTHVALAVDGTTCYFAVGGTVDAVTITAQTRPSTNPTFTVGTINGEAGGSTTAFDGNIDELRITKGVARYTATFTAPTLPFPGV